MPSLGDIATSEFGKPAPSGPRLQHGLSLIELMISLVIGLLITAAVGAVFLSGGKNYRENDRFARMQENGRFAVDMIASDLIMASFWGTLTTYPSIVNSIAPNTSCNITHAPQKSLVVINNQDATAAAAQAYCIDSSTYQIGTGIVALKYTNSITAGTQSVGKAYLRSNPSGGSLFIYDGTLPGPTETDWEYVARVYYIRNTPDPSNASRTIPVLARKYLVGANMNNDETLLDGIEDMQIEVGLNSPTASSEADIIPAFYAAAPTAAQLPYAVTARIYILVRSLEPDSLPINKTYRLGSKPVAKSDNYRRKVFTTTVVLRNPNYQLRLNSVTNL